MKWDAKAASPFWHWVANLVQIWFFILWKVFSFLTTCNSESINVTKNLRKNRSAIDTTSVPEPSRWDGDEDPGKIRFIVPKFWEKNRMRSATQRYLQYSWIRLCRTAHAIFFPKFWNDKTNFTRVFVTVSPRRPWDRGCYRYCLSSSLCWGLWTPVVAYGSHATKNIADFSRCIG